MPQATGPRTDGERWARDELRRLRESRFAPAACAGFLGASHRRARDVRRSRPDLARQARAWTAAGAGLWVGLACAGVRPFHGRTRHGLAAWATAGLMLDWHLGMAETFDGRPRRLGAADAVTLARAWLAPAVAARPTFGLCAAGLGSDVLDGILARAGEPTRLGRDLEGLADAAFGWAALAGLRRDGALGTAAVAAETARFAVGAGYGLHAYFLRAQPPAAEVRASVRAVAPVRGAGLLLAAAGHRRLGEPLMILGSLGGIAAVRRGSRPPRPRSPASR